VKLYYVYILECSDESYYVGVTNNLERRLNEHNEGLDPKAYTYRRRPVKLLFHAEFNDVENAITLEKQLKGWRREKKLAVINGDWDKLPELAKCKNKTRYDLL
jgi:putative endonuclease